MKLSDLYEQLLELSKKLGVVVRKESGNFSSGYCIIHEQKVIVFNRSTTLETKSGVLARCLVSAGVDNIFVSPAIRDFIDKENSKSRQEFHLDISDVA
ncbi:MAG: hypothetical protein HW421_2682 [Ignavibacteria bacterium]|nr:hypothetical protein [Ignavibacteria bacterium]